MRNRFPEEPLWLDLRWAKTEEQLSLRNPKFSYGIARLAAPLHGKGLDEISGEDVRQHKFTMRLKWGAVVTLTALFIAALGLAYIANESRKIADENRKIAEEQTKIAREAENVANENRKKAEEQTEIARRGAYNAQIARASDLWKRDPDSALRLLADTERVPKDLRDFSWRILYRASKKNKMTLTGLGGEVNSVTFFPDGKTLASGSLDATVKLWGAEIE